MTDLANSDARIMHRYLLKALDKKNYPVKYRQNDPAKKEAASLFYMIDISANNYPETLNKWIDKHLDGNEKVRLNAAFRQSKRRDRTKTTTITIDDRAHMMISLLSKKHKLSLSKTIERYLKTPYSNEVIRKYKLKDEHDSNQE